MIQVADVGVGISGQEGMQVKTDRAVQAASPWATSSHGKGWPLGRSGARSG